MYSSTAYTVLKIESTLKQALYYFILFNNCCWNTK